MTTRELFQTAFRAARAARHADLPGQPSPLAAALDATAHQSFPVAVAAARVANLHPSFRRRASVRLLLRPATSWSLANLRARNAR